MGTGIPPARFRRWGAVIRNIESRRDRVIEAVVSRHLESGEPVSSRDVCERCGLGLSPATIRSLMKELEDDGFLVQPHTSAGRIPTVKCYRYYVRNLMPSAELDEDDLAAVKRLVADAIQESDADLFLTHVARALSQVTDLIGVVVSPSFEQGIFDRLEIVNIGGSRFVIIASLTSGLVKTISITVDRVIARRKVEETARLLTARLNGLTVTEIRRSIAARLGDAGAGDRLLLDVILRRSGSIFGFSDDESVHVAGLSRLLAHPDFASMDTSRKLAGLFERKTEIAEALRGAVPAEDVGINIGGSGPLGFHPPLALVSASYHSGTAAGSIAVIGPARVHYPRLTAIVRYTAVMANGFFST